MKAALVLTALLASAPMCFALTLGAATENLLYFEYASLASDHCERQKVPTRPVLKAWQGQHEPLFRASIDAVRTEGKRRGLASEKEQDALLFEVMGMADKKAKEHIARKGVPCGKYGTFIDGLATSFKR
ncbi:hypothetical protein RT97_07950 [Variovorax paradoxus]|jgi:hypothetical protein|uniref:Uncharacterized protein n=1 Tax=Variovorax paradoxus TaxID=34073 RepID=A0A0D0LYP3_VARPD|nr:hypothetical protein [Variovorax paradoxus]KIQ34463.1 hypothetical protein RT97_07950 [Variovorax paradoxus]